MLAKVVGRLRVLRKSRLLRLFLQRRQLFLAELGGAELSAMIYMVSSLKYS
jgi:hypothetical protein